MKLFKILCFSLLLLSYGCGMNDREKRLDHREETLSKKQQELLLWENRLMLKEKELNARKTLLDSTSKTIDSAGIYDPAITGKWLMKMRCTETSCDGSAIGDTKTEQWDITYNKNNVVVTAFVGDKLTRIYNGLLKPGGLVVADKQSATESVIQINLRPISENRMEGTREIIQKNCKIVYLLVAERLQ